MQKVYEVKLLNGQLRNITCDPCQLRKEIGKLENTASYDCLLLYDNEAQKIISTAAELITNSAIKRIVVIDSQMREKEFIKLKSLNQSLQHVAQELQTEKSNLQQSIKDLQTSIEKLKLDSGNALQKLTQQNQKADMDYKSQLKQMNDQNEAKIQDLNQAKQKTEEKLGKEIKQLKTQIDDLQQNNQTLLSNIEQFKLEKQKLENTITQQKQEFEKQMLQLGTKINQDQQQLHGFNQVYQQYQQREQQWQAYYQDLQNQFVGAQQMWITEKEELQQKMKKDFDTQTTKYNKLKIEKEELEDQNEKLNKDLQQQKNQQSASSSQINSSNQTIQQFRLEIENHIRQEQDLNQQLIDSANKIRKFQAEIVKLNSEIKNQKELNSQLTQEKQDLQEKFTTLSNASTQKISELGKTIQNLLTVKKDQEEQIHNLKSQQERLIAEHENTLSQKGQQNSEMVAKLTNEKNQQKKDYDKKLSDLNNQRLELETQLREEISQLNNENTQLKTNIENNQTEIQKLNGFKADLEAKSKQLEEDLLQSQNQFGEAQLQIQQLNAFCQQREQQWQNFVNELQMNNQMQSDQEKEDIHQKYKNDLEVQQKKYNQIKNDKEEVEIDNNKMQKEIQQLKNQLTQSKNKLEQADKNVKSLEEEMDGYIKKGVGENQVVQAKEKEVKKLQGDIVLLNKQIEDEKFQCQILKNQLNQLEQEQQQLKARNEDIVNQLNDKITSLEAENGRKHVQLEANQKQISIQMNQIKNTQDEKLQLNQRIYELQQKIQELSMGGENINKNVKDLYQQIDNYKKEIDLLNHNHEESLKKQVQLTQTLNQTEGQLRQLKLQYESLQRSFNDLKQSEQDLIQTSKQMTEDFQKTSQDENQRFNRELEYKDLIIKQLCQNQQYVDKVVGPLDQIMNSEYKINYFALDPNSQRDHTEFIIYEIVLDKIKATNQIKSQKWIQMGDSLQYQNLGSIKTIRSIQANADATFLKGYIIQIEEADNVNLIKKKLLRKEFKQQATSMLPNKEEAGKQSLNNQMCRLFLDKFNELLANPKIQGKQIQVQRQFVLQVKGKEEYCYCEMIVEEQPFEKINGGAFQLKDTDIHQYLNAFSLFTYHIMNRQLIITNLQVVGQYLHDMIVSTQYKIFTPIDQGSAEITQTLGILDKAPQAALSKFWNDRVIQSAKQGWK